MSIQAYNREISFMIKLELIFQVKDEQEFTSISV